MLGRRCYLVEKCGRYLTDTCEKNLEKLISLTKPTESTLILWCVRTIARNKPIVANE